MHCDLPNRRDLIVGTLLKFLSKTMVLIVLLVRVVAENEAYVQPTCGRERQINSMEQRSGLVREVRREELL